MKPLALILVLLATPAGAHDWYPSTCCSGQDCAPVQCDTLSEGPNGSVTYTPRDKTFSRYQVKPSLDDRCHVCIHWEYPACVFVQQES